MAVINNPAGATYTMPAENEITIDNAGTVIAPTAVDYIFDTSVNFGTIDITTGTLDGIDTTTQGVTQTGTINNAGGTIILSGPAPSSILGVPALDANLAGGVVIGASSTYGGTLSGSYADVQVDIADGSFRASFRDTGGAITIGPGTTIDGTVGATGSVVTLDAGGTLGASVNGGTIIGLGGAIGGPFDNAALEGSFAAPFGLPVFQGTGGFSLDSTGRRAQVSLPYTLYFNGTASFDVPNATLILGNLGIEDNDPGTLTIGPDTDLAPASGSSSDLELIDARTAVNLEGTLEGAAIRVSIVAGGAITNTGTIKTVAGETLDITSGTPTNYGTFTNDNVLDLVQGSTIDLNANATGPSLASLVQPGVAVVFSGSLDGSAPGPGTLTISPGGTLTFGVGASVSNVTVMDNTAVTVGGAYSNVTWMGDPFITRDNNVTSISGAFSVLNASGGPGTIVVAGTNNELQITGNATLQNVTLDFGQSVGESLATNYSLLTSAGGTVTLGPNTVLKGIGNELFQGFDLQGTLALAGDATIAGGGSAQSEPVSDAFGGIFPFFQFDERHFDLDTNRIEVGPNGEISLDDDDPSPDVNGQQSLYALSLNFVIGLAQGGAAKSQAATSASAVPAGVTSASIAAQETTIDGGGGIVLETGASAMLNAKMTSGTTIDLAGTQDALVLANPGDMAGTLTNVGAGDAIDLLLDGYTGGAPSYANGQLIVPTATGNVALNATFAPGYSVADIQTVDDTQGGTALSIATTGTGSGSANTASFPDVSAAFASAVNATILAVESALTPAGTTPNVFSVIGAGAVEASVAGVLNALVVTSAPTGTTVTLPGGYAAGFLLNGAATLSDGNGNSALIDATANATLTGAGGDTLFGGNANATITATSGAETIFGGTGANLVELGAATALANTYGTDTIVGSTAAATVNAAGAPLFFGASGTTVFNAQGSAATLAGGGAATVNAVAANVLMFAGAGGVDFAAGAGISTIVGGAGGNTLTGGAGATLYFGAGANTYVAGTAVDTVVGFNGQLTATGGANGTLFFTGTAGGSDVSTGAGSSTIIGFGAGDSLSATGPGNDVIEAAAASETINATASSGTNTFFAFGQNDLVQAGAGSAAIQSYLGNQTLAAGSGADLFAVVASGKRAVTFVNFKPGQDFVQLQGFAAGTGAAALSAAVISGGGEVLTLPDGTILTFQNVTGLAAASFV